MSQFKEDMKATWNATSWGVAIIFIVMALGLTFAVYESYLKYAWGFATREVRLNDAIREERMSAKMNASYQGLQKSEQEVAGLNQRVAQFTESYGTDQKAWPQGKREEYQQLQQLRFNAVQAYNNACAGYNAVYKDEFQATAAPDDLPKSCPFMVP